jgi:hypothetical protein
MSQANIQIVRRVIDVMDAEGFEAAPRFFSTLPTRTWNGRKIRPGLAPLPTEVSSRSAR